MYCVIFDCKLVCNNTKNDIIHILKKKIVIISSVDTILVLQAIFLELLSH